MLSSKLLWPPPLSLSVSLSAAVHGFGILTFPCTSGGPELATADNATTILA